MKTFGKAYGNDGFTFIESILSIIILSLVLSASAPLFFQSWVTMKSIFMSASNINKISLFYASFSQVCTRTLIPAWAMNDPAISLKNRKLTVAYLDGKRDAQWAIEFGDNALQLSGNGANFSFAAKKINIAFITNKETKQGVEVQFEALQRTWHWKQYFAKS